MELLFSLNEKKVITSIKHSDHYIEMHKDDYLFKSKVSLEENSQHSYIMDVFKGAFKRTKGNIGIVYNLIKEENALIYDYFSSKLRISCYGARNLFIKRLLSKLKRMEAVFDASDKSNIILVMKEKVFL